ncbi:hypothetical protein GGR50DRAFT_76711 [Xylaria sp. CBS 124048]|nr:hypothetical protein GGR50DRAFT_76711 [Xylaria sp. CBS 124048]
MYAHDYSTETSHLDPASQAYSHSGHRVSTHGAHAHFAVMPTYLQQPQPPQGHARRSPSVNTFSTTSSHALPPAAFRTSPTGDIRRSTSSGSTNTNSAPQTSYVALLRKQKATVWSDRAQAEDPRLIAQQRAAKQRAAQEVAGRLSQARTSTGLSGAGKVVTKFRHHGKPGVVGYAPDTNFIGGVPLRLSATEVEGEDSEDDDASAQKVHHRRTGSSGRSSMASGRRGLPYRTSDSIGHGSRRWSPGDTPNDTPERGSMIDSPEYTPGDDQTERPLSTHSTVSSGEKADALPELGASNAGKLASNSMLHAALTREKSVKNPEELKRRGSVDERTMTLSSGRLFIANPD